MLKVAIQTGGRKAYTTPNKYINANSLFYMKEVVTESEIKKP
jgi:hypothetical protein